MSGIYKNLKLNGNIYWALVLRLMLAMFLFSLCRIGFYLYNTEFFPEMTFANFLRILMGGLRFDLTAVLYINSLMILLMMLPFDFRFNKGYQTTIKYIFFLVNSLAIIANLADFIYYKFTLRRTTADFFMEFEDGPGGGVFFRFLFDYWYVTLFFVAIATIMVILYSRIKVEGPMIQNRVAYYSFGVLAFPIVVGLFIGGARGGFKYSTRPITLSNAGEYVTHPAETNIVLNTPFSIFRSIGKTKIQKVNYFESEEKAAAFFNPVHQLKDSIPFKADNVVVILLESFSREFMKSLTKGKKDYQGYTPFLDSLIQHSKTFEYSFANGRKSIDGPPSVTSSLPTFQVPFVLTPYSNNKFNSLASLLKVKGYHTSFFIGHPNGAMGYTAFTKMAGYDNYFGLDEYGKSEDSDGIWGIWDHKFLPFFANQLNEFPQPFFSTLFTVSSHHPFVVPKEFEGKFNGGDLSILKCIEYTDYSLRELFKKISKEPWYKNTLFVFTADHASSEVIFEESHANAGLYAVPIIFFKPDNSLAEYRHEIAQQIDIMPTVLGYLHYDKPYVAFGRDLFREKSKPVAFNYRDAYYFYRDQYALSFDGKKTLGLYNFTTDTYFKENLLSQKGDVASEMETQLKAIIQQYNNRLVGNKLTVD